MITTISYQAHANQNCDATNTYKVYMRTDYKSPMNESQEEQNTRRDSPHSWIGKQYCQNVSSFQHCIESIQPQSKSQQAFVDTDNLI